MIVILDKIDDNKNILGRLPKTARVAVFVFKSLNIQAVFSAYLLGSRPKITQNSQ